MSKNIVRAEAIKTAVDTLNEITGEECVESSKDTTKSPNKRTHDKRSLLMTVSSLEPRERKADTIMNRCVRRQRKRQPSERSC
jgi:hypothetical protein